MTVDARRYARRVIGLHGGYETVRSTTEKRREEFDSLWQQDAELIARILGAHLAVEHYLTEYLLTLIPHLSGLEKRARGSRFNDPKSIVQQFNLFAAGLLQAGAPPEAEYRRKAYEEE